VAAAVHNKIAEIDAVEIDPIILQYGRRYHPHLPYNNPNVKVYNNDARNFIRYSKKKYDLIIYGLLDSHVALSNLSNVRLESFVYTLEALKESREKLSEDGLIYLNFFLTSNLQSLKFYKMLRESFDGLRPRVFINPHPRRLTFIIGPGLSKLRQHQKFGFIEISQSLESAMNQNEQLIDLSTDDWPFIYMETKRYPVSYLILNLSIFLVGFLFIRQNITQKEPWFNSVFFFLGAGFMLLETKAITELGLLFGSTWNVVSVVILAILFMAYLGNLCILKGFKLQIKTGLVFLILSLIGGYYFGAKVPEYFGLRISQLILPLLLTLPIFFSGLVFSRYLREKDVSINSAMASNLIGALVGGLLEYNALYLGYRGLYLLALVMYLLAILGLFRRKFIFSPIPI
jgi:hypothetical protein